jgi:hypothetical protein
MGQSAPGSDRWVVKRGRRQCAGHALPARALAFLGRAAGTAVARRKMHCRQHGLHPGRRGGGEHQGAREVGTPPQPRRRSLRLSSDQQARRPQSGAAHLRRCPRTQCDSADTRKQQRRLGRRVGMRARLGVERGPTRPRQGARAETNATLVRYTSTKVRSTQQQRVGGGVLAGHTPLAKCLATPSLRDKVPRAMPVTKTERFQVRGPVSRILGPAAPGRGNRRPSGPRQTAATRGRAAACGGPGRRGGRGARGATGGR